MKKLLRKFYWWLFQKRTTELRVAVQFTDAQVSNMKCYKKFEKALLEKNVSDAIARMLVSGGYIELTSEKVLGGRSYTSKIRVIK